MEAGKPKANRGGKRPGAGRPPKEIREIRDQCNRVMDAVVIPELPELFRSLIRQAKGECLVDVWVPADRVDEAKVVIRDEAGEVIRRTQPDGTREILTNRVLTMTEPDSRAGIYLIDRYLGRPFQAVKVIPKKDLEQMTDEELASLSRDEGGG